MKTNAVTAEGQNALHQKLGLQTPFPFALSYVHNGAKRSRETDAHLETYYPPAYATDGSLRGHLRFAFKYEPLDLGLVYRTLQAMGPAELTQWLRDEPTSKFSRRAWFLYEHFTGDTLDVPDAVPGGYVDALDTRLHYTAAPQNSPRHQVRDNLLGGPDLCPTLRRTAKLETRIAQRWGEQVAGLSEQYAPQALRRAASYLYTKETRSSFAIEGETPGPQREARFLNALESASDFDFSKNALIQLQNAIVDPRYAASDWRHIQIFVGHTQHQYRTVVDFICPRAEDVPQLMRGWRDLTQRTTASGALDPVLSAALSAFAFVFVHPFEDGNGRLHRFLIHAVLSRRRFTPPGLLFPISAAIQRDPKGYDATLKAFSKSIQQFITWDFTEADGVSVQNDTCDLYRFWDATPQAEFLYDCVAETVQVDFKEELNFLTVFDAAVTGLQQVVDMPDRRAHLLLKLIMQNGDRLSAKKRDLFPELTDEEIAAIEQVAADARGQVQ